MKIWPNIVYLFLLMGLIANILLTTFAFKSSVGVIEEDPYHAGLNFQREIDLQINAEALRIKEKFFFTNGNVRLLLSDGGEFCEINFYRLLLKSTNKEYKDIEIKNENACESEIIPVPAGLWFYKIIGKTRNKDFLLKGKLNL